MTKKQCRVCGNEVPEYNSRYKNYICLKCQCKNKKERGYSKANYENNREKYKKHSREYYGKNKLKILNDLKNKRILNRKSGACEICGDFCDNLCSDHNHITGNVRGMLCKKCNTAIGVLKTDMGIDLLCSAISYIRNYDNV